MKQSLLVRLAFFVGLFLLFFSKKAAAQDPHFSQTSLQPLHQNPALTGIFDGHYRAGASFRSQWSSVPAPFQTISFFADGKAVDLGRTVVTAGLRLDSDKQGDAELSWSMATLFGAVWRALNPKTSLSAGFGVGFGQRAFDISKLRFKEQFVDGQFAAANPSGEQFNRSSGGILDVSTGLNVHFRPKSTARTALDLGVGLWHLTRPQVSFRGEKQSRLGVRTNVQSNLVYQASKKMDGLASFHLQPQASTNAGFGATYLETVASAGLRLWLVEDERAVSALVGMRFGDAVIPQIRYEWKEWLVGLSYDVNVSEWNVATGGRGGFEISAQYRYSKLPPVKVFKACPIF